MKETTFCGDKETMQFLRIVERFSPWISSVLLVFVWFLLGMPFPHDPVYILIASTSFSAVIVGFLATIEVLILMMNHESIFVVKMSENGYFQRIVSFFWKTIRIGMLFSILSIVMMVDGQLTNMMVFLILWVFLIGLFSTYFYRSMRMLIKIVTLPRKLFE